MKKENNYGLFSQTDTESGGRLFCWFKNVHRLEPRCFLIGCTPVGFWVLIGGTMWQIKLQIFLMDITQVNRKDNQWNYTLYMYIYIYIHLCVYIDIYVFVHTSMYIYIYVYISYSVKLGILHITIFLHKITIFKSLNCMFCMFL